MSRLRGLLYFPVLVCSFACPLLVRVRGCGSSVCKLEIALANRFARSEMADESSLASGIYENLRKCIALREKYMELSLQRPGDNPLNYVALEKVLFGVFPSL